MKKLFLSLSALAFIFNLSAQTDGTGCNKAIILPAPAQVHGYFRNSQRNCFARQRSAGCAINKTASARRQLP